MIAVQDDAGEVVCGIRGSELTKVAVPQVWAGMDIGEEHHHCVVIDADGRRLLLRRVLNDEQALLELIGDVLENSPEALWAVDLNHGGAALLIALLAGQRKPVAYLTGLAVHRASGTYRGVGKTDAREAFVIADQARMRRGLGMLRPCDETAAGLRILTVRRSDLVTDRTRQVNRLRALMLETFPALERAFDYSKSKGALILLGGYQTPAAIRRAGASCLEASLRSRKVRGASAVASTAVEAAGPSTPSSPGKRSPRHSGPDRPGDNGPRRADRRGQRPGTAPRDSGRVSGNLHRPRRYHRGLLRVFYLSSLVQHQRMPASRLY